MILAVALFVSGCTRHKRGNDAFEHYFGIPPPEGLTLIQAQWAGFYIATGLDAEQIVLEFVGSDKVIADLFQHEKAEEKQAVAREVMDKILGWKTVPTEAIKRSMEAAPKWFAPADVAVCRIVFLGEQSALVEFPDEGLRYRLIIYDHGNGRIYIDRLADRVYIAQENGKLF